MVTSPRRQYHSAMRYRDILFGGTGGGSWLADLGLMLLRGFTGVAMAVYHGADKMKNPGKVVDSADDMGFPAPFVFGWLAVFAEFFGGVLLALGLATRPAAFLLSCTMATAAFIAHAGDRFPTREKALLYLFISVLFMLIGSGRYGLDALLRGRGKKS